MVAGLKFLTKKAFNPQNMSNRKRVWEAEQREKEDDRKFRERQKQLERERDEEEVAIARGEIPKVGFMYAAPPGMNKEEKDEDTKMPASNPADISQRQPGDDDAAAQFRMLLASGKKSEEMAVGQKAEHQDSFGVVLHGSNFESEKPDFRNLSKLEQAVGRNKRGGGAFSLEEQIQRFPALANAPRMKGVDTADVGVNFKPLGSKIRTVRCHACGLWGHQRGDRECKVSGWDPFATKKDDDKPMNSQKKRSRSPSGPSDNSSDDSSSSYERRRRKKHKKRRKHKKSSRSYEDDGDERRRERKHHKKSKRKHREDHRK